MEIVGGGTHRQIAMLAHELISRGHTVKIYTLRYLPEIAFPELMTGLKTVSLDREYSSFLSRLFRIHFIGTFSHQWLENRNSRKLALRMDKDFDMGKDFEKEMAMPEMEPEEPQQPERSMPNLAAEQTIESPPMEEHELDDHDHDAEQQPSHDYYPKRSLFSHRAIERSVAQLVLRKGQTR